MFSPAPIVPEKWSRPNLERMQQDARLPRFRRGSAIPLTLLTQWTGATTVDAGCIDDAQAPIGFSTLLLVMQGLPCRTAYGAIGLESKVLSREVSSLPGPADHRLAISLHTF